MVGVNVVILCFMLFIMIQAEGDSTCKLLGNFGMPSIFKEGDIMLGGIFPLFNKEESHNVSHQTKPPVVNCVGFDLRSYRWAQVMMFAIKEINKDHSLLPNITLGYTIFDSCATPTNTLRAALSLVSGREEAKSAAECHPPISAVIAEAGSTQSLAAAGMFGPFGVPMVSYFSTCACLSDRTKYRTFFRTIPSDYYQAKALASLIKHFGWTWIGAIQSDTDYGRNGVLSFIEEVKKSGVCIAFIQTILRTYSRGKILQVAKTIIYSKVKVILAFAPENDMYPLIQEVVKQNITGIQWIASEAWITAARLSTIETFHSFGGVIGFVIRKMAMPKLRDFLVNINPFAVQGDPFVRNFWETMVGCDPGLKKASSKISKSMKVCTGDEKLDQSHSFFNVTQLRVSYNVYKAAYAIAHALHNLMFCVNESENNQRKQCIGISQIVPKQVSDHLQRVNFLDHFGEAVFFDKNGDPPPSYEIINWQLRDGKVQHVTVGHFSTSTHGYELLIKEESIVWNTGKSVPKAVCSEICPTGTRKAEIKDKPICCFDCIPCADGTIANRTGAADCISCPQEFWSNKGKDQCIPRVIEFLSYRDPMGIALTVISLFGVCLAFATIVVFFNYKNTPIVKATNSELSSLLLLSLLLCFLCPLTFIGEPTVWSCMLRHTAFGITFALCISCVLGKTIVVVTAFKATIPNNNMARKFGPVQQRIIVCSCTTVQICICVLWLTLNPPFPDKNLKVSDKKIILVCNTGSETAFYVVLGYIGFLSAICLVLAFLARKLPDNFNEAKFITFSMLIFCAVWLTFIPAYVSSPGKYTVAVEIFAILSSTFGLLFCIFAPKCYIILIKPEKNTRKNVMGKPPTKRV